MCLGRTHDWYSAIAWTHTNTLTERNMLFCIDVFKLEEYTKIRRPISILSDSNETKIKKLHIS